MPGVIPHLWYNTGDLYVGVIVAEQGDEKRVTNIDMIPIRFEEIEQRVKAYIHHPFLERSQIRPVTSRFHFDVAAAILQATETSPARAIPVLEALLLLQQGLSIHDYVDGVAELTRQLHVLSGDFCSSRYYWILARIDDSRLLDALCEAVVQINEAKMAWHGLSAPISSEQYMELQEKIHGQLLFALAHTLLPEATAWQTYIQSLVRGYVVKQEVSLRKVPKYFTLRQAYEWLTDAREKVLQAPANTFIQPILQFVMEYLVPIQNMLESQTFAEGNR